MMSTSILTSIKKMLGIEEVDTNFDLEILININSIFMTLNQIGIGPETGFSIVDKTALWTTYFGAVTDIEAVKTYMYLKVRLLFDPPSSAFVLEAMERQIAEFEWRLMVRVDPVILEEVIDDES